MTPTKEQSAGILARALPYIKEYKGKTIVVKYGGNAMLNETLKENVMHDIVLLSLIGIKVVLVHGGGPEISATLDKMGKSTEFVDGLRVTDAETSEIVQMVLCGKVNKSLVNLIGCSGGRAVGLCGMDGNMISATPADPRLGYVGKIQQTDTRVIKDLLDSGYIPVVSSVGFGKGESVSYNINADTAAQAIAASLGAESLLLMSDIPGLLRDKNDPNSIIERVTVAQATTMQTDGTINGGMIPKVQCCIDAIRGGVKKVFILDGRVPHSILMEVLTDEGVGTMFVE